MDKDKDKRLRRPFKKELEARLMQFTMDDFLDLPKETPQESPQETPQEIQPAASHENTLRTDNLQCYIDEGITSARAICERLILEKVEEDGRFITGKPKIYPRICRSLDRMVNMGTLELAEKINGAEDRIYHKVSN